MPPPDLKGRQWSKFRTDFDQMDLDSPTPASSPNEETLRSVSKSPQKELNSKKLTSSKKITETPVKPKNKNKKPDTLRRNLLFLILSH